jgi:hypothetical protein
MKQFNWKTIAAAIGGVVCVAAAIAVVVVATRGESTATAKKNFCNSLSGLSSSVMAYQSLTPTSTNGERDQLATNLEDSWNDVLDNGDDWVNANDNALTQAYDNLYWAIQGLPSDNTLAEDLQALQPELSAFPQAFTETFDGSGCTTV